MSAPLRWLLMASHVPPGGSLGGIVRYTVELARALGGRDDVELHLTVQAAAAPSLRELVTDDDHLHPVPGVPEAALPLLERYLPASLQPGRPGAGPAGPARGPDVVHGVKHLLPRGLRPTGALGVLTVHDMILLDRPDDFGRAKRTLLQKPYLASLRDADVPVCVSAATRDRLRAWVPGAAERAAVTPLASSPRLLGVAPEPIPQLAGKTFALVVGDPTPRKNVPVVVDAWAQVVRERPDAVLALVGPPSWGASVYGPHAEALEAAGQLVRLVKVPDAQLAWAYRHAAVALCPSLVEGFGLPVVEGLDLGAPVVISQDPALVEAAAGRAAAVLPFSDPAAWAGAVLAELATPTRRAAPEAVDRRGWDDVADDTVTAVRAALARRAASA